MVTANHNSRRPLVHHQKRKQAPNIRVGTTQRPIAACYETVEISRRRASIAAAARMMSNLRLEGSIRWPSPPANLCKLRSVTYVTSPEAAPDLSKFVHSRSIGRARKVSRGTGKDKSRFLGSTGHELLLRCAGCQLLLHRRPIDASGSTPDNFGNEQPYFLIIARRFIAGAYGIHSQTALSFCHRFFDAFAQT